MKLVGVISTAVLSMTLGIAAPAYAQEQHDQQQEEKAKPAEQEKQKAQPAAKQEEKNTQQQNKNTQQEEKNAQQQHTQQARPQQQQRAGNNSGKRIPDDRFKANFGREHSFRVSQGDYRNHRFQYGGYSFGFVDAWPSNWLYTQDVYVIEIDGVYYLCNPMYPGVNLVLSFES